VHTSTADAIARRQEVASLRHALAQAQHQTERQNAELEQTKMAEKATQHTLSESMEEGLEVKRIVYDVRVYDVRVYDVWERLHEEETTNRKLTSELIQVRHTNKDNACLYKEAANTLQQAQHTGARERESDRARETGMAKDLEHRKKEIVQQRAVCLTHCSELDKHIAESMRMKQEFAMLQAAAQERGVGVGLIITQRHPHIITVVEAGSATACGEIVEGDVIIGIDGTDVEEQDMKVVRGMLLGPTGSRVHLALKRGQAGTAEEEESHYEVTIIRGIKKTKPRFV